MSSPQPLSPLLNLTPELLSHIISQVDDKPSLSALRLTCKTLDEYAVPQLFASIFLSPSESQMAAWTNVARSPCLRKLPRRATIHARVDIENDDFFHHDGMEIGEGFFSAITLLGEFPGVQELDVGFTPQCVGRDSVYDAMEEVDDRGKLLREIFQAVADRAGDEKKNRPVHSLQMVNLQNCPLPGFTSSPLFEKVMRKIGSLHVLVAREINTEAPDNDFDAEELILFPPYFVSHWLYPVSSSLRHLSLYQRDNWGPFPGEWSFGGVSFPRLETLCLGYYTLAHDSDVSWILATPSLKKVVLHNCMIASYLRFDPDSFTTWAIDTTSWVDFPFKPMDEGEEAVGYKSYRYSGTWAQVFDKLATLPQLEDFRFDYGNEWEGGYGLKERERCGRRVFSQRYVCFDQGTLPSHWGEADGEGEMEGWGEERFPKNMHKEELEGDQASLARLVEGLRRKGGE